MMEGRGTKKTMHGKERELHSYSSGDTEKVGKMLGSCLRPGDVVLLYGEMGTGKTEFAKGIAKGLQIEDYVTSPTFTIVNEYEGKMPLYHFDVYRVADEEEMGEIGFETYLYGDGAVIIEWPDLIKGLLPVNCIEVRLAKDMDRGEDYRHIRICTDRNWDWMEMK